MDADRVANVKRTQGNASLAGCCQRDEGRRSEKLCVTSLVPGG